MKMKKNILIILTIWLSISCTTKKVDTWVAFSNTNESLIGFKDSIGQIKITPKFSEFTVASKFQDIIAVSENSDSTNRLHYYLLKNGQKIGRDSMFIFDMAYDCESEGFIRFHVKETDKMGMFDKYGKIAIPPRYDGLSQVRNGLVLALKGATKETFGEHWMWKGGQCSLIDKQNNTLVEKFPDSLALDYYSLQIANIRSKGTCQESYLGKNGRYYIFDSNEKSFKHWFFRIFLKDFSPQKLIENTNLSLFHYENSDTSTSNSVHEFVKTTFGNTEKELLDLQKPNADYHIFIENSLIVPDEKKKDFEQYHDNCDNLKTSQFPVHKIIINHGKGKKFYQNIFTFFKSEKGFQLIFIRIKQR
jgi:hypothetical protein